MPEVAAQDPFIYKGRLGYHVVCHDMERGDKSESDGCRFQGYEGCSGQVGLHAYAREILPDGCAAALISLLSRATVRTPAWTVGVCCQPSRQDQGRG